MKGTPDDRIGLAFSALCVFTALARTLEYLLDWTIWGFNPRQARGWTSLIFVTLFSVATQLFCIGILGLYIGRLFEETKRRPCLARTGRCQAPVERVDSSAVVIRAGLQTSHGARATAEWQCVSHVS